MIAGKLLEYLGLAGVGWGELNGTAPFAELIIKLINTASRLVNTPITNNKTW